MQICYKIIYWILAHSTNHFVRWMNGTCVETPAQRIPGEDEPFVFSFHSDISTNPEVIGQVQSICQNIKNTLTSLSRYVGRWKKFRGAWKVDKVCFRFWVRVRVNDRVRVDVSDTWSCCLLTGSDSRKMVSEGWSRNECVFRCVWRSLSVLHETHRGGRQYATSQRPRVYPSTYRSSCSVYQATR